MKVNIKFKTAIILSAIVITLIPLILSYSIFISSKLTDINENIRSRLKEVGYSISKSELIKQKLYTRENDGSIQKYTEGFIDNFKDVDIIVVGDMKGEKYSHLDESQIGEIYVNEDNKDVLKNGSSYYSLMEGSMGLTFRWFQPIYYNGTQIGFVMVGKYYRDITVINIQTKIKYSLLFAISLIIAIVGAKIFADKVKKLILNMEPVEIAALYREKNIIINSVKDGIIALDKDKEVIEVNKSCYELFDNFVIQDVINKLSIYIDNREEIEMREFIILNKKIFVTIKHINLGNNCLRTIITLIDKNPISKIAKEITGVDEVIKNLRANVHEFKNNLYVISGLINIKAYDDAKKYILKIQQIQDSSTSKFAEVKDNYVRGLLISRNLVAKERKIKFSLTEESFLYEHHDVIDSNDVVTILGNLIENAFEACIISKKDEKKVEVSLYEDDNVIEIEVRDNGVNINSDFKDKIFNQGVSTKGEGRGTGLYLVRNRVELYNGSIEIEEFCDEKIFVITISKGEIYDKRFNS